MDTDSQFKRANSVRLGPGEFVWAAAIVLALLLGPPLALFRLRPFPTAADYRLPYEFSNDYWLVERWLGQASRSHPVVVVGDSVVWGEYAAPGEALPAQLNRVAGAQVFANLGLNGLHPLAMQGLLRHHGRDLRGTRVVLVLNLLWLSSAQHDLRAAAAEDDENGLNHPELLPQFSDVPAACRRPLEDRLETVLHRIVPFPGWVTHLENVSRRELSLALSAGLGSPAAAASPPEPAIDMPHLNLIRALLRPWPLPASQPHSDPLGWQQRGMRQVDIDWPTADESGQLPAFLDAVDLLKSRKNDVFVLVSPFNLHMLGDSSRAGYAALQQEIRRRLTAAGVASCACPAPESEEYADASHPLADGYARLARALYDEPEFRRWVAPVQRSNAQ